ncbi:SET domain-containing protein 3 [Diplodia seriata]
MTEIPLLQTHAVPQLSPRAPFAPVSYPVPNGRPVADAPQPDEEPVSDTIKCICGYEADDGSSVLCEVCRTWQHVLCYYDDEDQIPRVHECADCQPRALDQARIKERQKAFKNMTYMIERKPKRSAAKSHKKKLKDVNAAVALTNGHADDTLPTLDRKSGSPKDHQPPSKRPKTNHKASGSVTSLSQSASGSRKRAASTAQPVHSPVKSPGPPIPTGYAPDYFSDEFMQLYQHPEYTQIEANSFSDLAVTNSLQTWLWDPEATKQASGGKAREQIFQRHEGTMKSLEEHGPVLKENTGIGAIATVQGPHPTFKWITVESDVPCGGFVGELKGQIGRKEEYCSNLENRWGSLRHPAPFVFFAPFLPLYIDTRHEGTLLRYIRRSCRPNVRMQILITGESEYHFCFIALENIYAGEEISIGWDIDKDVKNALEASLQNGNIHERGIQEVEGVSHWVAGVLSNFGGCACKLPIMECPLALADRRNAPAILASSNAQPLKSKKPRRNGNQNSPLSTGQATNSRAGSEARNRPEHDDENADSRSVSGSSRSKPTSRDITPMTHVSNENAVGLGVEMSDREKRKLMQQEKLFEQLEHDEQHAQRKRKRNSAGSALNTPSVATSKQLGHSESSFPSPAAASKSRAADPNSRSQNMNGRRSNNSSHQRRSGARVPKEPVPPKKPEYKDSSMQTEPDKEFPSLRKAKLEAKSHDGDRGDEKDRDKDAAAEAGDVKDEDDRPGSSDKREESSEAKVGEGA